VRLKAPHVVPEGLAPNWRIPILMDHQGLIQAGRIAYVFFLSDILGFVVQGIGGSILGSAKTSASLTLGKVVVLIGLGIQVGFFLLFAFLTYYVWVSKLYNQPIIAVPTTEPTDPQTKSATDVYATTKKPQRAEETPGEEMELVQSQTVRVAQKPSVEQYTAQATTNSEESLEDVKDGVPSVSITVGAPMEKGVVGHEQYETVFRLLFGTICLLIVRNIYRFLEFAMGTTSYVASTEWVFYTFDSLVIVMCLVLYTIYHPGFYISSAIPSK